MSNSTESPFSYTIKCGKNKDLLTGRADTFKEMTAQIIYMWELQEFIEGAETPPVEQVMPDIAQAVANLQAAMPATVVAAPAVPTPVPQVGARIVKHPTWEDTYFVYDHPEAMRMPDGRPSIMKHAKSQAGKVYQRWQHPVTGPEDPASGKNPPWDGAFVDRSCDTSMLPHM